MNNYVPEDWESEFEFLEKTPTENRRASFLNYCKKKFEREKQGQLSIEEASNRICSASSLFFKEIMPEFSDVMDIACDLELPIEYRDRSIDDWGKLKEIINRAQI